MSHHDVDVRQMASLNDIPAGKDGQTMCAACLRGQLEIRTGLAVMGNRAARVAAWLRDLSDGYVAFDDDPAMKLAGPISVKHLPDVPAVGEFPLDFQSGVAAHKAYFIGRKGRAGRRRCPA